MKEVLFAVLPEAVLLDIAGPAEALRLANQVAPGSYSLRFLGTRRSLQAGVGLRLARLLPLPRQVPHGCMIVITGVTSEALSLDAPAVCQLADWLSRVMRDPSVTLLCVCAGSLIAAKAGLLDGRACTTHHEHIETLARLAPAATVHADRIFVEDGPVFTSAGVTSGIDLTLYMIGQQLGAQTAAAVARGLVVYMRRAAADPQLSPWVMHRNHLHPAVHKVQDAIMRDPVRDWSAGRLAALACMSPRNLSRLFAHHAGCSPLDYVQRLRIALARELVLNSDLALERIAERSGFNSAHQLRRVWRRWEPRSPSHYRAGPR